MTLLLLFLLAVVLSATFSGLETGIYTTSRLRLFLDEQAGVRAARRARGLLADMPSLLTILLVANNMANQAATTLAQLALVAWDVPSREVVGTVLVTTVLFLLAESVPKAAFHRHREGLLYPVLPLLLVARALLYHVTLPISWCASLLQRAVRARSGGGRGGPGRGEAGQAVLRAGAAEGFLTPFQERVARGVLSMRSRTAGEEAVPLAARATCRLGRPGVELPPGSRDHRVLVLDEAGRVPLGWVPLARLWTPGGFRAARRDELQPVVRVEGAAGLDRVYVHLDRSGAPFAVVEAAGELRVLDATGLRQRVMGAGPAGARS